MGEETRWHIRSRSSPEHEACSTCINEAFEAALSSSCSQPDLKSNVAGLHNYMILGLLQVYLLLVLGTQCSKIS
jgi:hypothetical protein